MKIQRDPVDGRHVIDDFEHFRFSTAEDAREALEFAIAFVGQQAMRESAYRRAAERGQQRVAEVLAK